MDSWPVLLQQKLNVAGFEYLPGNTAARTDMDIGPAKVRSRFTDAVDRYSCSILLEFDEVPTFKTFYKQTLVNGTLPFLFTDPFTETEEIFRFAETPRIRPLGGITYELVMVWEKLP